MTAETLQLLPAQVTGVDFITGRTPAGKPHKLCADPCGSGKTVMGAAAVRKVQAKSVLVICPAPHSIKNAWRRALIEWGGIDPKTIWVVGKGTDEIPTHCTTIIVSYQMLQNASIRRQCHFQKYDAGIIDEASALRSVSSKRSNTILGLPDPLIARCHWKWFFDGTIMPNRPWELFPLLSTCFPEVIEPYNTYKKYGEYFCGGESCLSEDGQYRGSSHVAELKERLKAVMIRRPITAFWDTVPEVVESDLYIDVGDLADGADETNTASATLRKAIGIAKIPYIAEYVKYRREASPKQKLLVFTYHREVTESLNEALPGSVKYYGGMTPAAKQAALDTFLNSDECYIMIAQVFSAGIGLDGLQQVCNNIVVAEPDWSGGIWDQLIGRLKRYGQVEDFVDVVLLIAEQTLEDKIVSVQRKKQYLMKRLIAVTHQGEHAMSAEQELKEIKETLKELVAVLKGNGAAVTTAVGSGGAASASGEKPKADSKPKADPKPKAEAKKAEAEVTKDQVREAAKKALNALGGSKNDSARLQVKGVMQAFSVEALDDLDTKHYAEALRLYGQLERGETITETPADDDVI